MVIYSVGSDGRDYPDDDTAIADLPAVFTEQIRLQHYNDSEFLTTTGINISGLTTTAAFNLVLECAPGESFRDSGNHLRYDIANGVGIRKTNSYGTVMTVSVPYTELIGLQLSSTGIGNTVGLSDSVNITVDSCIVNSASNLRAVFSSGSASVFKNSVLIANEGSSAATSCIRITYTSPSIFNCTMVSLFAGSTAIGLDKLGGAADSAVVKNSAIFGFGTAMDSGSWGAGTDYNATDNATLPVGSNNLTSLVASTQFRDISSSATLDLRLNTGNALDNSGLTDVSVPVDIFNTTRSATPSIGAYETYFGVGSRVFIKDTASFNGHYTSTSWLPSGEFKVTFKIAKTTTGTANMWLGTLGDFAIRWIANGRIGLYPSGAGGSGGFYGGSGDVPQTTDLLHEVVVTANTGNTTATVEANGVLLSGGALPSNPDVSGGMSIVTFGDISALTSSGLEGVIADIKLEDVGTPANTYTWAVDLSSGSVEAAQEGGKDLTYVGIGAGLPNRELFALNGAQYDGNNGTTLTIAYPLPSTGVSASIDSTMPSLISSWVFTQEQPSISLTTSISSQMPSMTSSASLTHSVFEFDSAISSVMPSLSSSAIFAQYPPEFDTSLISQMPSLVSAAGFTQSAPLSGVAISSQMPSLTSAAVFSQSVPVFDGSITSVMPSLLSSVAAQALVPSNNSSITAVFPSLTSSANITIEDPKALDATVISTMPSLLSSTTLYNGIINIVIGEGNNIDIVVKSRNINIQTKSRNI